MITTLIGTTAETVLTMWLFGSLWKQWTMAFKVTTPMLHVLFAACQLWGSWNFYGLWRKQLRHIARSENGFDDGEIGTKTEERDEPKTTAMMINERELTSSSAATTSTSRTES
jgi:hypothetical protein